MNNNPNDEEDLQAMRRRMAEDLFETNKNAAARERDGEMEIAAKGPPPVDLRIIPREAWGSYEFFHLTLPPAVVRYMDGRDPAPFSEPEEDSLVAAVAKYHGVRKPWYVDMDVTLRDDGRVWKYVPEVAPMFTGFLLMKDEK